MIGCAGTRGFDYAQGETPRRTTHTPIAGRSRPGSSLVDQGTNAVASILSSNDYPGKDLARCNYQEVFTDIIFALC